MFTVPCCVLTGYCGRSTGVGKSSFWIHQSKCGFRQELSWGTKYRGDDEKDSLSFPKGCLLVARGKVVNIEWRNGTPP